MAHLAYPPRDPAWEDEPANGYIVNPKVEKIIEDMKNDPDHQALMKRLAKMDEENWDNEGGLVTDDDLINYEERLKYMEEYGI
jgi:hypothetical protein